MFLGIDFVTSITGIATVVVAFLTLLISLVALLRATKNSKQVIEIHQIVNSANMELKNRVEQLAKSLQEAGVAIPPSEKRSEA
jgi:uncharacterized membrane protein